MVLFGVIFFWTPPHFWALAMRFNDDYAAAGVPMLPVVAEATVVARQIIVYTWAMVATSLLLVPVGARRLALPRRRGRAGRDVPARGAPAAGPRARAARTARPMRLFHCSITYLTLLFLAIAVGQFVG